MKLKVILNIFLSLIGFVALSQNIIMTNGSQSVCSGTFLDPGGTSNYANSSDYTMTLCSSTPGQEISVEFTTFTLESVTWDHLTIYEGSGTTGTILAGPAGSSTLQGAVVTSTGSGCLTFVFHSDGSVNYAGWEAQISCVSACQAFNATTTYNTGAFPATINLCTGEQIDVTAVGNYPNNNIDYNQDDASSTFTWDFGNNTVVAQNASNSYGVQGNYTLTLTVEDVNGCTYVETYPVTVTCGGACSPCTDIQVDDPDANTCTGTFWDTGMGSDYTNSENQQITLCPDGPGQAVNVNFIEFNTESCCDHMIIYDGNSTASPMITGINGETDNNYEGTDLLGQTVTSTSGDGCLTFAWTSDASVVASGWLGEIFCSVGCQAFDVSSTANGTAISGSISSCITDQITFSSTATFPNNDLNYHQDLSTCTFEWDFGNGTTATGQNVNVTYNTQGSYTVTLTVTDVNACPMVETYTVDVACGGACPVCTDIIIGDPTTYTCTGTFWDSGMNSDYSNSESYTTTICSDNGGFAKIHFLEFQSESLDRLLIYDGPDNTFPLIGTYSGTAIPPDITASGTCLTYSWTSDGSVVYSGWKAELSCMHPCQDFDLNVISNPVEEADGYIHTCPGTPVDFTANLNFPNNNINYFQEDANTTISWETATGLTGTGLTFSLPADSAFSTLIFVDAEDVNGCHVYDTLYVVSECQPIDVFIATDAAVQQNGEIFLPSTSDVLSLDGSHNFPTVGGCYTQTLGQYTWTFGYTDGNGGDIYSSHAEDTVITFPMNGVYTVELQVYDQMNCFDETSIEVHVGCQPIDVSWTGSPAMLGDTVIVCPGDSFDLTIFTDYFANDILYHQEDATSVFNWNMADGTLIPNTMDFGTYSFAESGLYNINLQIQDAQGCVDNTNIPILSFMEPSLAGTTISTDTICFGDSLILYGNTTVDMPTYSAPPVFLPDGQGFAFTSTLTFDMFGDAILTDINDFESVCLNLEHSYTGDLRIRLYCPNGQFTELLPYPNGCGSNFLGEPVDNDASNTYGTGYYYCFTPTATVTIPGVAGLNTYTYTDNDGTTYTNHIYIPAGDYAPTGTFEDLIGCPLNGDWSIEVTDNLGSDNGMIFDWNITLNQDGLLPPDTVQLPMDMRVWTVETGGAAIINTFFEDDAYATPLDTGLYTFNFTVTSPAGCTYDTIVGPLYVAPMPIVNLGNDTNLCAAYTYEIPGTLSGGTGTWSFVGPGNATFSNNNSIPTTVTVDTYGTYTFLFTPNTIAACSNPEMINVTFHELPIIDAIIDSTNCYASCDGSITTNELGVEGPYNYNWSNADITPSISGLCAGVYDVEVYTAYCLNYFSYEVLQPTELMIIDSGYVDNLCFGESNGQAWISVEGGTPNYTYAWSNNGSTSSLNTALADGVYTVTVQDYYGCAKTSQITVSGPVAPLAIDEIVATDISCFGMTDGMLEPIVNGGTAPYSYHWVLTDGTISNSSTINNLQAGTYFLTVTDYNNCTTTGSQIIQESNQFIVEAFTTGTSCYGSSDGHAWVTSSGGSYPFSYAWNTGYTDSSIVNSPAANYSITVTDARGCSVSVNNIQVTQPDQVNFTIIPSAPICIGQTAQLSMSVTGSPYSPYSYYWNGNLQAETIHVSPTQTTNYTAQVIDANGCESDIKQVTVQVYNPIAISTVIDPIDICEGETVSVHVTATGGNGEYTYQLSDGQMVSESFILQPGNTSEYELVVQDNCGSPSDTSEFTINVAHTYLPSFYADIKNGCAPLEVNFIQDIQSHAEGTRYVWTFNDTEEGTIAITANTEHLFKGAGEYDVNLKIITPEGCESEKTAYNYITVYPIPKSEFVALPSVVTNVNPSVYFENHSIGANIWQWDFGDGDSTFAWNVTHMYPSVMQNYDVSLIVISDYGCRDTSYKRVKVIDEVTFYIPTGFTPDNDNRNELFRPYGTSILEEGYNMKIYDRWGEVIFETNELEKGWDGKVKDNSLAPQGVYPYMIRFVDVYGVPHERTGYINVVR